MGDEFDEEEESLLPLHAAAQIPEWGGVMLTGLANHAIHAHNLISGYRQYYKYFSFMGQLLFTIACVLFAGNFWHIARNNQAHENDPELIGMPYWRWAVFGASIFPIVHISHWAVACLLLLGEMRLTQFKNSMYIMIGVAAPLRYAQQSFLSQN